MKKHIFLVLGNIGVGKTTVCNKYPVTPISLVSPNLCKVAAFNNLYSLGRGWLGADSLLQNKTEVFADLQHHTDKNILIHGVIYSMVVDVARYASTHHLHVLSLELSQATNVARLRGRNPNFKEETIHRLRQNNTRCKSLLRQAELLGVDVLLVDAEQSIELVRRIVWNKILKTLNT